MSAINHHQRLDRSCTIGISQPHCLSVCLACAGLGATSDRARFGTLDIKRPSLYDCHVMVVAGRDLDTGTQLSNYKGNGCGRNAFCCLGRDYLVAAQLQKDSLHFWAWHRDQVSCAPQHHGQRRLCRLLLAFLPHA